MNTVIEYDLSKESQTMKRTCIDAYYTLKDNYLCIIYVYEYESWECRYTKSIKRLAYIEDACTREYIKSHPHIRI